MRKAIIPAFLLLLGSMVLGATVLREPIARASAPITSVFVTNDSTHPVPVHEQGTANVNVTNATVPVHEQGAATAHVDNFPATQAVRITGPASSFSKTYDLSTSAGGSIDVRSNDPGGTRYAITSLTVTPTDLASGRVGATLFVAPWIAGACRGNQQELLSVTATNETSSVSLSQPIVSDALDASEQVCLTLGANGGTVLSLTGYTLP